MARGYPVGARLMGRNGVIRIKGEKGWNPLARFVAVQSDDVLGGGDDLRPGQKVYHLDMSTRGTLDHDRPENLVVIQFSTTKFKLLPASRIIHMPKEARAKKVFQFAAR